MAKQFVKITQTYAAKNRLCTAIIDHFESVDHCLFANKQKADEDVKRRYNEALQSYRGKAAVPKLDSHKNSKSGSSYYIDGVIHISIYNVENDLS